MPGLMQPQKKDDITMILGKLKGSSTSENSSEALKAKNEENVEIMTSEDDQVDSSTAQEAAAQSLMSAITAQNPKAIASAIIDLIKLTDLEDDKLDELMSK
jgi:hypothetical protein